MNIASQDIAGILLGSTSMGQVLMDLLDFDSIIQ